MPWFKSSNSPSSSSSSPKSFDSPISPSRVRRNVRDLYFFRSRRESQTQPRLTRQRKLRHLSDLEVGGLLSENHPRSSSSANSTPVSRSPSKRECSSARVSSPLPLPLPDLVFSSSNRACCPLPSPKSPRGEGEGDGIDFRTGDGMGERVPLSSALTSRLANQTISNGVEHVDVPLTGSTLDRGRKPSPDPSGVENIQNFRLSVPTNSAPTSSVSSPVRSPRRMSTGDFFPSTYMPSRGLQVWSDPEFQSSEMRRWGFSTHTSPEKFAYSPEHSPLHSPTVRSPRPVSTSPSGAASPLHPKISPESSGAWHGSNGIVTVHPLPLPPGAAVPSQSSFVHQPASKSEVSFMMSQWQKGKLIGSGTFGNVYVATNRETGALCAMKEVNLIPDDPKSAECMKQLEQEIEVLSQLKHPNIVQYYGSEIVGDRFYICLEYVYPGSISKYFRDHCEAVTESVVRNFTRHILSGLEYLHSTRTIHRDIKGANLLVDAYGVVKLADFGMAKHLTGQAAALSLKGSPYWMAPEVMQAMMNKDSVNDLAVDIWSMGCTIIEMFTGKAPWSEFEGAAAMFKILKNESPPIPDTLSAEGKDFLQRCFRRNPADRPTASELLQHRFVRGPHSQEIRGCCIKKNSRKLMDVAQSPRNQTSQISPSTKASKGKQLSNGETALSHPETSKSTAASRHSPRSTLEAIPSLSPPHSNHSSHNSGASLNVPNGFHLGAGNNRPYSH
ncbi:mitogen-activated protein kinase kinase kinase 5-like [Tasmannia lanceolata]|uniref:mitogen-activated protein kinase kinase kinase 5-like n=1 Tax=Tasmannia lanceolata TaxID=3420 RepID=UPI004064929F